ncbi:M20/M25/M40 family metallo-hydrolase [Marinifilum flexuosum]|uniref:Peptidase M28-like protein n=1 Tax=Marinifilum flexuosum TaxID=1117708 RepID=A0A419X8Z8_9BACT|nr:M20/M25/M40 family metallo-hydrolase [Marinifilum flexuosum]RKE04069.1 peptidase M28-like protein [Marinifilum flexuosum]
MKEKIFLAFIGIILSFTGIRAQSSADLYSKDIKAKNLKEHVYILASDSCAGRDVGTLGIKIARDYIVSQWEENAVLQSYFENTWFQAFSLLTIEERTPHLQSKNTELFSDKDFMYSGIFDSFNKELPLVFAGYGREEDYKNLNVKGKAVLTLHHNLRAAVRNARIAKEYGAELTIVANPKSSNQFESIVLQFEDFSKFKKCRLPNNVAMDSFMVDMPSYRYMTISSKSVKKLTGKSIQHWKNEAIEGNEPIGEIKFSVEPLKVDTIIENNVVAYIPGSNANESIVVGAHYDHLGTVDGKIYNGADDNASGVSALIELSKAFAKAYQDGYKPEKNIIFAAFSAEEGGIWGSKYFADHLENKEQVKLMINIDMIGRADYHHENDPGYFYFIGKHLADSLYTQEKQLSKKYKLTSNYSAITDYSDNKSFSDIGIPSIFFFDGKNHDLHKPTDTANKVNYKRMEKISRMIFETIWRNAAVGKN